MLQIFGNKERNKKILIGIFICILPGFLLWGTSSVMKSSKEAGEYKGVHIYGKKVSAEEYRSAMQASKIQAMMQFGENYSQIEKLLDMRNRLSFALISEIVHFYGEREKERQSNVQHFLSIT